MANRHLFCLFTLLQIHILSSTTADALNPRWKSFIAPDILEQYMGNDQTSRFMPDLFEGDIMGIDKNGRNMQSQIRDVFTDSAVRFEGGLIHYKISDKFTKPEKVAIESALKATAAATTNCLRFVPATLEQDYISFIRGFACFSSLGFQGGNQLISLTTGCKENVGVIQHVLMHALGFYHENARLDRDKFISLNNDNIVTPARDNFFKKYVNIPSDTVPYDLQSITHYPFNVFAEDFNLPTIVPKKRDTRIGQTDGLSEQDIAKIRKAYDCSDSPPVTNPPDTTESTSFSPPSVVIPDDSALADITPDPPDDLGTTTPGPFFQLPVFRMDPVTEEQCQALNTDNCQITPASKNCAPGYGYIAVCTADALNVEVEYFFSKIRRLNASRGLEITVKGVREFTQHTFAPVANSLIILIVADFPDFHLSMLRNLELPIITHIGMTNCSNVVIKQDDLLFFPRLTMFILAKSTVKEIEEGAFDSLKHFREVTFDTGYSIIKPLAPAVREHVRLLHCDCRYDWLRAFLKRYPYLLMPRQVGEIHTFGGILSNAFTTRQIFIPTDCSKPGLIGDPDQMEFTINTNCPSEIAGSMTYTPA